MIHHPLDFAMETSATVLLAPQRETFVAILPTDLRCSDQVLALPESQRKCINSADYDYVNGYRQSSCILDCQRSNIHQTCGCHPYFLPEKAIYGRMKPIRECNLADGLCLAKNYGEFVLHFFVSWFLFNISLAAKFKNSHCDCLPSCYDVSYKVSSFVSEIPRGFNYSLSPL